MERHLPFTRRRFLLIATGALCMTMASGCGDPISRLLASDAERTRLWDMVAGSPDLSRQVVDRLLATDSTRAALLDRVLETGAARQAALARVATDRSLMEGAVHFAVQDTAMRAHLMTLFRGMEMGSAP